MLKRHLKKRANPSIRTHTSKIENRINFKMKTGHCLEIFTPETIKLLGRTKINITKYENGENVSYLEIAKVVLIHCNVVKQ